MIVMKGCVETPAVFSVSRHLIFKDKILGSSLARTLGAWLEGISGWLRENDYLMGHLKILATAEGEQVRISLTKGPVNSHSSPAWPDTLIEAVDLYVTLIVFGPDHDAFRREVTFRMNDLSAFR